MTISNQSQDPWGDDFSSKSVKICPSCGFKNKFPSSICEICDRSLITRYRIKKKESEAIGAASNSSSLPQKKKKELTANTLQFNQRKESKAIVNSSSLPQKKELTANALQFNQKSERYVYSYKNITSKLARLKFKKQVLSLLAKLNKIQKHQPEIIKPINILGLLSILIILILCLKQVSTFKQKYTTNTSSSGQMQSSKTLPPAPRGLFSYGGAALYAPLVSSGLNGQIENAYPGFELRYTKPINNDFGSANGIKMLIEGELSLAYSNRPLTDSEIQRAAMRGFRLKQTSIAIDGLVFFASSSLAVPGLNLAQIKDIYQGKITTWDRIDPQAQKVPIVPIILKDEDLAMLGVKQITSKAQYADNYTQLLRKVISTPGAITFASASLVKRQELIKTFGLAQTSSSNYISAFLNERPNLNAFKQGYPATRLIFLIYREDGTSEQKAAEAYVNFLESSEGQKTIKKSGLVPLG